MDVEEIENVVDDGKASVQSKSQFSPFSDDYNDKCENKASKKKLLIRKPRSDSDYSSLTSPNSSGNVESEQLNSTADSGVLGSCFSEKDMDSDEETFNNDDTSKKFKSICGHSLFELKLYQLFPESSSEKKHKSSSFKKRLEEKRKLNKKSKSLMLKLYSDTIENSNQLSSDQYTPIYLNNSNKLLTKPFNHFIDNLFKNHDFPENNDFKDVIQIKSPPSKINIEICPSFSAPSTPCSSSCFFSQCKKHRKSLRAKNRLFASEKKRTDNDVLCSSLVNTSEDDENNEKPSNETKSDESSAKIELKDVSYSFYSGKRLKQVKRALF